MLFRSLVVVLCFYSFALIIEQVLIFNFFLGGFVFYILLNERSLILLSIYTNTHTHTHKIMLPLSY